MDVLLIFIIIFNNDVLVDLSNIAFLNIHVVDYRCIISGFSKSDQ